MELVAIGSVVNGTGACITEMAPALCSAWQPWWKSWKKGPVLKGQRNWRWCLQSWLSWVGSTEVQPHKLFCNCKERISLFVKNPACIQVCNTETDTELLLDVGKRSRSCLIAWAVLRLRDSYSTVSYSSCIRVKRGKLGYRDVCVSLSSDKCGAASNPMPCFDLFRLHFGHTGPECSHRRGSCLKSKRTVPRPFSKSLKCSYRDSSSVYWCFCLLDWSHNTNWPHQGVMRMKLLSIPVQGIQVQENFFPPAHLCLGLNSPVP